MKEHKIPASEDGGEQCGAWGCHANYMDNSCIAYGHHHFPCEDPPNGDPNIAALLEERQHDTSSILRSLAATELTVEPTKSGKAVRIMACGGVTPVAIVALSEENVNHLIVARSAKR